MAVSSSVRPSVSVIVVCLNAGKQLEATIRSFAAQSYAYKELIIIDGGSTDVTKSVLKKYRSDIRYAVSEPDKGIADAFNKGVKAAKGDYIIFLGAGDYFFNRKALAELLRGVDRNRDWLIAGRVQRVSFQGEPLYVAGGSFRRWQLLYKMAIPHQGLLTSRQFLARYGSFNLKCRYAMDYDLLLRAYRDFPRVVIKNTIVACWREGGVGTDKTAEVLAEYHRIRLENAVAPRWLLAVIYRLSKLRHRET